MPGRSALLVVLAITWSSSAMPASPKHLGVASCASSVCHGSVKARSVTRIPQNEYVIWSRHDRHRNAYKTLLTPASRRIAANLGLANAHEADVCLDCHADNVPPAQRGERFQINDGVTCEACHGGAGAYIDSHTQKHLSHADRVESGLLPIDDIDVRAALCFSCHLGNADKSADHRIMGAGHPRLSFELDTFSVLQPAHYVVDEDYLAEKWAGDHLVTWVQGQISAARHTLSQIEGTVLRKDAVFPELSMFDCHACHHSLDDIRWQQQSRIMLPPGTIRLNDVGFRSERVTLTANQNAAHTHMMRGSTDFAGDISPANNVPATGAGANLYNNAGATAVNMSPEAVPQSGGAGQSHNNVMPFLCVNFIVALFGIYPSRT